VSQDFNKEAQSEGITQEIHMPSTFLKNYLTDLTHVFKEVSSKEFEEFIADLDRAYRREANIFIFGNGGSASAASHFACDMNKGVTYGMKKRFRVICLNDNLPTILAYANDVSYDDVFTEQLKNLMKPDDLVIGVSGSGNSENVLRAVRYASDQSAITIGICGFGGGRLKKTSHHAVVVDSQDMQKVEDIHNILFHCAMQWFQKRLGGSL
jgi:D-sedoheptulose 7-phosphate isomerase